MPAAIGLVDLGVLLALALLIALSYAYNYSLGAAIVAIARALGAIRLPGILGGGRVLGFAADALEKIDHTIRHQLGVGIEALQATWNECISYTAQAFHWIGKEIASLSHDTTQAIEGLALGQVKPWVNRRLVAALAAVAALKARVLTLERSTVAHVAKVAHVVEHKTVVITRAIAVPDVGALPRAIPRVGQLEREIAEALARAKDLVRRFAPAAAVATVAFAAARLGFGWARCSKVGRVGRGVCGMNDGLLESLLADALLVVGAISVVEFAKELQAIETATVNAMRGFVREI